MVPFALIEGLLNKAGRMISLSSDHRRYIRKETLINAVVNTVISAFFVWVAFRGLSAIPLWGNPGLALDLVPTCVAITLVSAMVLTLTTRARLKRGRVAPLTPARGPAAWLPGNVIVRALTSAIVVTIIAVPVSVAALKLVGADGASFNQVLIFKIVYGAALSALISPPLLMRALADASGAAGAVAKQTG